MSRAASGPGSGKVTSGYFMKRSINWGWWRIADGSRMNLVPAYPKEMIPVNRVLRRTQGSVKVPQP